MWAQAWETSCHVAHLHQHYLKYYNIFITFLGRLGPVPPPTRGLALGSSSPPGLGRAAQWIRDRDRMAEAL